MTYQHNENIIKELRDNTIDLFEQYNPSNSDYYNGDKFKAVTANRIYTQMTEDFYIISPNPTKSIQFLVYELGNIIYFCEFNDTRTVQRRLKEQYKTLFQPFRQFISFKKFIHDLDHYKEKELTSRNILLKDGYIYDFDGMKFERSSYMLPTDISRLSYKELKDQDEKILDKCFNKMYPDINEMKKFFYYMLCNLNKDYAQQTIFLIIDKSEVGKSAKLMPCVEIGLNTICDSRLLEKSELYNIAYKNSIIYNETQNEKFNGATLTNLADSNPFTVSKKGDDSLTMYKEDKPVLQVIGESLPFFKHLSDGTKRRFLLVPQVAESYLEFINDPNNGDIKTSFYNILYHKSVQVIQYYIKKINEYNIFDNIIDIKKSMTVTLNDLELLTEGKEEIFGKYFNLYPLGRYDECNETRYLIDTKDGLNLLLEYIDNNIITTNHFNNKPLRVKYLRDLIKKNVKVSNIRKDLGSHNEKGKNYFYFYCLTPEGVELVDKINNEEIYDTKIEYLTKYPFSG